MMIPEKKLTEADGKGLLQTRGKGIGKNTYALLAMVVALALCIIIVWMLFSGFLDNYKASIAFESADHLVEINYQIKLYIEEKVNNDWRIARSIANSITSGPAGGDEGVMASVKREREIWGISDIVIYTENGYSISADGEVLGNDSASEAAYNAQKHGAYMTIVQSKITYTISVETNMMMKGARIAAISIEQNLDSFIDNMNFSSFDGEAYIYLAQDSGACISHLTHESAEEVYNVLSLFDGKELTSLGGEEYPPEYLLLSPGAEVNLMRGGAPRYVVSIPINTEMRTLRLFYFVPEAAVNQTMNGFSIYITKLSLIIIGIFSAATLLAFAFLYRAREKEFDGALIARDRLFDLLVKNTRNAFALLNVDLDKPLYSSSNTDNIAGFDFIGLVKRGDGYLLTSTDGEEPEAIANINRELAEWDGKSEFISHYEPFVRDGVTRYFAIYIYPVEGGGGEFVGIAQDVTQVREREEALKVALAMADSANEAKTRFLSNMSHDIRTPMNAILNMSDFAIETIGDPETQRGYLITIRESSEHLLHLINDVLDMSRIESGRAAIAMEPFDIAACIRSVCEMVSPLYEAKGQTFETELGGACAGMLIGDQLKLSQILINLLNNAGKFTKEGGRISFSVEEMPSLRADAAALRFVIEDNGMGISEKALPHIFEPFMRVDDGRVRRIEGTGLGLSICKSYIAAMGGTISCKSREGEGSVFTLELSFPRAEAEKPAAAPAAASFAGKRALLCEDNETNRLIARRVLERLGFEVDAAENGEEGVRRFTASAPGFYDIIYMDIQMPLMNGYEATAAIRGSHRPDANSVPIVAMTANVFVEDVERSRAAGMNGHLGKPLIVKEMSKITNMLLNAKGEEQ